MAKSLAYILMIIGVVLIALPLLAKQLVDKFNLQGWWVMVAGLVLIALGFVYMKPSSSSKHKQVSEEVPIYQKDKIVGYRKSNK